MFKNEFSISSGNTNLEVKSEVKSLHDYEIKKSSGLDHIISNYVDIFSTDKNTVEPNEKWANSENAVRLRKLIKKEVEILEDILDEIEVNSDHISRNGHPGDVALARERIFSRLEHIQNITGTDFGIGIETEK